jgi:hypothetical protein
VKASTPPGDPGTDLRNNPTDPTDRYGDVDRHGDVDINGDLVDELDQRLAAAITATTPELADEQLRRVKQVVRPWTVRP